MYKYLVILIPLILVTTGYAGSQINMKDYGPQSYATITNVLDRVGSNRTAELVFDGGAWPITNNTTFTSNLFLRFVTGSYFEISTNAIVTISGVTDNDWNWKFRGTNSTLTTNVVMTYTNLVYIPKWFGLTNDTARYQAVAADLASTTFVSNVVTAATNAALVTSPFWGTNFNYNAYFAGYPRLTLTTNMISSSVSADTPITQTSWTNGLDNNWDTQTSIGTWNADSHAYSIDLGAVYSGYFIISIVLSNSNPAATSGFRFGYGGVGSTLSAGAGVGWWESIRANNANDFDLIYVGSGTTTNMLIKPFVGSKIGFCGEASAYSSSYAVSELLVYGVTNGFQSISGSFPR